MSDPEKFSEKGSLSAFADADTLLVLDASESTPAAKVKQGTASALHTYIAGKLTIPTALEEVSTAEAEAGTSTTLRNWSPVKVAAAIAALETGRAKVNATATAAPTATNDETQQYEVGSLWVWKAESRAWLCIVADTNVAVWLELATGSGSSVTNNATASRAPLATDDSDDGYTALSLWLWPGGGTNGRIWICLDATVDGAVWLELGAGGSGGDTYAVGTDIADAAVLAPDGSGDYYTALGSTTVTGMNAQGVGSRVTLEFAASRTLTHHASDFILLTSADITTAAGDIAVFREYEANKWKMVDYARANGTPLAGTGGSGISDLVEDATPQLGGNLDTNDKMVLESKGTDVASASALSLSGDGNFYDVTGTTAITSIGTVHVGAEIVLQFDGALTLTHNATDLILPTGANITTAAGDVATFREYQTGDWICTGYLRADGSALSSSSSGISDVVEDTTPQLGGPLDSNGKMIQESRGTDVASASSLTLTTTGNFFHVTGTTTVTSIGTVKVGTEVTLKFTGALTLTHHATDLILPTGDDITTAAGDTATFVEYATGDWICTGYLRANGQALATAASGGNAAALVVEVNDTAHGLSVGDYVQRSGASTWNGTLTEADVQRGVVSTVVDADNYEVTTLGVVTGLSLTGTPSLGDPVYASSSNTLTHVFTGFEVGTAISSSVLFVNPKYHPIGGVVQRKMKLLTPGAAQSLTTTFADVTDAFMDFEPRGSSSKTTVRNSLRLTVASDAGDDLIAHFRVLRDAVEESNSSCSVGVIQTAEQYVELSYQRTSWGTTSDTVKWQAREYSSSYDSKLFETRWANGAIADEVTTGFMEIIEYRHA